MPARYLSGESGLTGYKSMKRRTNVKASRKRLFGGVIFMPDFKKGGSP